MEESYTNMWGLVSSLVAGFSHFFMFSKAYRSLSPIHFLLWCNFIFSLHIRNISMDGFVICWEVFVKESFSKCPLYFLWYFFSLYSLYKFVGFPKNFPLSSFLSILSFHLFGILHLFSRRRFQIFIEAFCSWISKLKFKVLYEGILQSTQHYI